MEYIRIMSRQLQRQLQGCVFQSVHGSHAFQAKISQSIMCADICELDNTDRANCDKKEKEIVIFTDGSVFGGPVGCGVCAAAFPEVNDKDGFRTEVKAFGKRVRSERCEIEGIMLGIQMAIQLYIESDSEKSVGIAYILCDCQKAIDALTIQTELNRFP